ncbi:Serine protease SPPA, chloroplastic [Linum perenne]
MAAELHQLLNPPISSRRRLTSASLLSKPNKTFRRLTQSTAAIRRHQIQLSMRNPTENIVDSTDGAVVGVPSRFRKQAAVKEEFPGEGGPAFKIRKEFGQWEGLLLKLRLLIAPPWQRVAHGSVLCMEIGGTITDVKGRWFSTEQALPEICENFGKAANDPRISGIFVRISFLECKFVIGYMNGFREKEYYIGCACDELYAPTFAPFSLYGFTLQSIFLRGVYEKMGLEPQWVRIGKFKTVGDQIIRKSISEPHLEVLNSLLDDIYDNWMDVVSSATGKTREELEKFINEGVYEMERVKEEGLITDILYEDEVMSMLKARLGVPKEKDLPTIDYKRYSKVTNWTLGLNTGEDVIGVIRASGLVVMGWTLFNLPGSPITPANIKRQIRIIRESKKYKAAIIRIDCSGGEALASDLIWREIKLLASEKPVIALLSDMAASGGYYIAMGATAIVAEKLSMASSIGVIQGKINYSELHERIGLHKDTISKGRYAEFPTCGHRPLRTDEKELLENQTMYLYKIFRDKAAFSRNMTIEDMEKVAQGRVWNGADAVSKGLVDAIGGMSRAIAIAKHKANIPLDKPVKIVELSKPNSSLPEFINALGNTIAGIHKALAMGATYSGAQSRFDGDGLSSDFDSHIFTIMKYFLKFSQAVLYE